MDKDICGKKVKRKGIDKMFTRKILNRLEKMLDDGIAGTFCESDYNEMHLSKIETKWKRFLCTSALAKENLEKEKENVKSLVTDISHQTKTPVANIKLYTALLEEQLQKREEIDLNSHEISMVKEITKQTEKLEFLIQALTKMSRLESNIVEVEPIPQPILPFINEVLEDIKPKAEKKQVQIINNCVDNYNAFYDRKWTKEAIFNILDNSVKYSNCKGVVKISLIEYEMYISIAIEDRGIGIKEEDTAKIFGRFYRAQNVQQEDGIGIGLYLAREILRKENGYMKVSSILGKGSTFFIYLPKPFQW